MAESSKFGERHFINTQKKPQQLPNRINWNRPTPGDIIIKLRKDKNEEQILNTARDIQGVLNKIISIFLIKNFGSQKALNWNIQSAKRKICQPRILYPPKLFF